MMRRTFVATAITLIVIASYMPTQDLVASPPGIDVSPDSISVMMDHGELMSIPITIRNPGTSNLTWYANISGGVEGIKILYPRANEQTQDDLDWIQDLQSRGATVTIAFATPLTSALMADYDILYMRAARQSFTPAEQDDILDFIENGGGFLGSFRSHGFTGLSTVTETLGLSVRAYGFFRSPMVATAINNHPTTIGVDTIRTIGTFFYLDSFSFGAERLADWGDGDSFYGVREYFSGRAAVVSGRPEANLNYSGDNARFFRSMVGWVGSGGSEGASLSADSGTLLPGDSIVISLNLDTTNKNEGIYEFAVNVLGDGVPDVIIPVQLVVDGEPEIAVNPTDIDYGFVFIGFPTTRTVTIANNGSAVLNVTSIATSTSVFTLSQSSLLLGPGSSTDIDVVFAPTSGLVYADTVVIVSDDPMMPVALVVLTGEGSAAGPPVIGLNPTQIVVTAQSGIHTRPLVISNTGPSSLNWIVDNGALPTWLDVFPNQGAVAPNSSDTVTVEMDAGSLPFAVYSSPIVFNSNDPVSPTAAAYVTFDIQPIPIAQLTSSTLVLPDTYVGHDEIGGVWLRSIGSANVTGTTFELETEFDGLTASFDIAPGDSAEILVRYQPTGPGIHSGTLTLFTNDIENDTLLVMLSGRALTTSEMVFSDDSLMTTLGPGQVGRVLLSVDNVGVASGTYDIALLYGIPSSLRASRVTSNEEVPMEVWETSLAGTQSANVIKPEALNWLSPTAFIEDFESGSLIGWDVPPGGATKEVTTLTGANGTNRSYHEANSDFGHQTGISRGFGPLQPSSLEFWIRSGSEAEFDAYAFFYDTNGTEVIGFLTKSDGQFYVNGNVGGHTTYAYTALQWYRIEFRDIDFLASVFDYAVDGVVVQTDVPFRNAGIVEDISRISLYNYTAGAEGWFDEIVISPAPAFAWLNIVSSTSGTVAPGDSREFDISVSATGLEPGVYMAEIRVRHDLAAAPLLLADIPIQLTVDSTVTAVDPTKIIHENALAQNHPNPFNPTTTITYDLASREHVRLTIYDVSGRRVHTLVDGDESRGRHTATWSGRDDRGQQVASGVYFYRIVAGTFSETRKMVLLK